MNTITRARRAIAAPCLAASFALTAPMAAAGDLNPPPGPVAPTMKSLDALAPGICINDLPGSADATHVISEPGLYVLAADVIGEPGKSAIAVEINPALPPGEYRVTIDLAGHSIEGVPTADAGIDFRHTTPGHKYIDTLTLRGPLTSGRIAGFDGPGIRCIGNADLHVSNLRVTQCAGHGIQCSNTGRVELDTVDVSQCLLDGVNVTGADECRARLRVTDCDGDGLDVTNARKLKACCLGSTGEDGCCDPRFERLGGNGVRAVAVDDIELSVRVAHCLLDGIHIENAIECRVSAVVADCDGDGLDVSNARKLKACCLGSTGEDGVEVRFDRCAGNGLLAVDVDEIVLAVTADTCLLDGVHVVNPIECRLACDITNCTGDGVDITGGDIVAINNLGHTGLDGVDTRLPPPAPPKRIAACGGYACLVIGPRGLDIDSLRIDQCTLGGIRCELNNPALLDPRVHIRACTVERCSGDAIAVVSSASPPAVRVAQCAALHCAGDGLHVSGARSVDVIDWLDDDSDDDGIEVLSTAASPTHVRVSGALSVGAGSAGLRLLGAVQPVSADLVRVTVRDAGGNAIDARNNLQLGSLATEDLVTRGSGGDGIFADRYTVTILKLTADDNLACGLRLTNSGDVTASDVHADNNGEEGMRVLGGGGGAGKASVQDISCFSNGAAAPGGAAGLSIDAMSSVTLRNAECRSNTGSGIRLADFNRDGVLDLVVCSSNGLHGVHAESTGGLPLGRCRLTNSVCDANAGDGVSLEATTGGEVSRCSLTNNNGTGLTILGNAHTVHANSLGSNLGGPLFIIAPGNIVGPLIDEPSLAGNCNPAANYVH